MSLKQIKGDQIQTQAYTLSPSQMTHRGQSDYQSMSPNVGQNRILKISRQPSSLIIVPKQKSLLTSYMAIERDFKILPPALNTIRSILHPDVKQPAVDNAGLDQYQIFKQTVQRHMIQTEAKDATEEEISSPTKRKSDLNSDIRSQIMKSPQSQHISTLSDQRKRAASREASPSKLHPDLSRTYNKSAHSGEKSTKFKSRLNASLARISCMLPDNQSLPLINPSNGSAPNIKKMFDGLDFKGTSFNPEHMY